MTRSLLLGLAWLALLVAPFSEGAAQTPSNEPAPWESEPAAGAASQPVPSPSAERTDPVEPASATSASSWRNTESSLKGAGSATPEHSMASDAIEGMCSRFQVQTGSPMGLGGLVGIARMNQEKQRILARFPLAQFVGLSSHVKPQSSKL